MGCCISSQFFLWMKQKIQIWQTKWHLSHNCRVTVELRIASSSRGNVHAKVDEMLRLSSTSCSVSFVVLRETIFFSCDNESKNSIVFLKWMIGGGISKQRGLRHIRWDISILLFLVIISRAEKNSMGNQSRPESRQESRSAAKESRIGFDPILFILLDIFIIKKMKNFVDDDCMQQFLL